MSRHGRQLVNKSAAVLSLLIWLTIATAEAWTPFHAWLHGGSIPEGDDCPVAALREGKLVNSSFAVVVTVALASLVLGIFVPLVPFVAFLPLPHVRGPPASHPAIAAP